MSVATESAAPARRRDRRRKLRAVLAAGLVLGIGGAVTLAAWNDSEYATGTFTAGTFNMQGSIDGTAYADHATTGAAVTLPFTVAPTNLSPGTTVYAPFAVRLAANTTTGASVTLQTPVVGGAGAGAGLTYSLIQPTTFGCGSGTTGTVLVPALTAVNAGTATFTLAQGAGATPGAAVNLCFVVTAGVGLPQTLASTVTWQFLATST